MRLVMAGRKKEEKIRMENTLSPLTGRGRRNERGLMAAMAQAGWPAPTSA